MGNNWFDRWIFESYQPTIQGLALFRIFASLLILFFLMPDAAYYTDLASFPDDFFTPPPGPMMFFDSFPPAWFFYSIHVLLALSWICVLIGFKTQKASIAAAIFMLILLGFIFSIGKVNHQMLIILLPLLMAFSSWGGAYSFDAGLSGKKTKANGWTLTLLALFIGFMMFTAGFPKILGGWLNGDTFATQGHLLNQYFIRGRTELLSGYMVSMNIPLIWGILDWGTVFFETGFLIAVLRAGWTRLFVCFAVFFHFSTMLTLNIAFLVNFPAYAAFLPWGKIHESIASLVDLNEKPYTIPLVFGGALFCLFGIIKIIDKMYLLTPTREPSFDELALISGAVLIVLTLGLKKAIGLFSSVRTQSV
ncbi:HTTM domain-containing protein [Rhodohalobacter sp. 8-1]|uniref:HTTM domain-containing protein n=1 Tax=Rhodohalobacter sp. 8-1 TaxID=3131972 RepID=UPI0030EF7EF8